jgi:putative transposase
MRDSFRESDPKCIKLDQVNRRIQLPKIGWVRYRNSREVLGEIRSVTVRLAVDKGLVSIRTLRAVEPRLQPARSSVWMGESLASIPCPTVSTKSRCSRLEGCCRSERNSNDG